VGVRVPSMGGVPLKGVKAVDVRSGIEVGVRVNVLVGEGIRVGEAVAGCGSGKNMVGKKTSEVGVE
jgi:hypothetical protein